MVGFAAQRLMELAVETLTRAAAHGARDVDQPTQRWQTHAGAGELRIRKLRKGSYFLGFLEPRRMAEKARNLLAHAPWEGADAHRANAYPGALQNFRWKVAVRPAPALGRCMHSKRRQVTPRENSLPSAPHSGSVLRSEGSNVSIDSSRPHPIDEQ
jgi:hypothetical protein